MFLNRGLNAFVGGQLNLFLLPSQHSNCQLEESYGIPNVVEAYWREKAHTNSPSYFMNEFPSS